MKKFEEELKSGPVSIGQDIITQEYAYDEGTLINYFKDWVSPEDHQAEIEKIELQNFKYREEIARMQKSLRKKNKAIKELNGAVKKSKARLKECEDLRIEANNEAAQEFAMKCELVEERAALKSENNQLKSQLEKQQFERNEALDDLACANEEIERLNAQLEMQQPEIPEFVANHIEATKEDCWTMLSAMNASILSSRLVDWLKGGNFRNQEIFAQAWLNGYTVAKEKRFYLKFNKQLFNPENGNTVYSDLYLDDEGALITDKKYAKKFTQQEIDSMETGSYEQIEVEE